MNPNYYSIIPADVRYSKDLCANAKLLYGEITALANKEGYCYASNQYFAELYDVAKGTISSWVSQLVKAGFVRVEIVNENERKIYLVDLIRPIPRKNEGDNLKDEAPYDKKNSPPKLKAQHINTVNNKENKKEPPAHNLEEQPYKIVQQTISRFLLENNMGKCKDDGYNLQAIADLCTTDDIQGEVWDMLMRYKSNEWWWGKMAPQPKQLWKAWDQLLAQPLPDWKRLGYGSEYEYNIKHKTQPSHHTTIQEIAEVQTVKVEPERVESFLNELEEMRK